MKQVLPIGVVCFLLMWPLLTMAQTYTIAGRVTDAVTGEGIPFVSVAMKGLTSGTTSDVDGRYRLQTKQLSDSLQVLSLGYN